MYKQHYYTRSTVGLSRNPSVSHNTPPFFTFPLFSSPTNNTFSSDKSRDQNPNPNFRQKWRSIKPQKKDNSTTTNPNHHLYNPYADLQLPAHKLYQLPTQPAFLFHEESTRQRRTWGENLTHYTGCGYLAGASAGAEKGLVSGFRAIELGDTLKLRLNRILNSTGQSGRQWGNRTGVIGLMFAGLESGICYGAGSDDVLNSVAAGLVTGALYKAVSGPIAAAIAGGVVVGVMVGAKHAAKRFIV